MILKKKNIIQILYNYYCKKNWGIPSLKMACPKMDFQLYFQNMIWPALGSFFVEKNLHLHDIISSPSLSGHNNYRSMFSIRLNLLTKTNWKLKTPGGILVLWVLVLVWSVALWSNQDQAYVVWHQRSHWSTRCCRSLNLGFVMLFECWNSPL